MIQFVRDWKTVVWCVVSAVLLGYWIFFATPVSAAIISNTLALAFLAALLALLFGSFLACGIMNHGVGARMLLVATVVAALLPVYIYVSAWDSAIGKLGWITVIARDEFHPVLTRWLSAIWIHGVAGASQVAIVLLIGWQAGRGQYEEQGLMDVGPGAVFWNISLRRMLPYIFVSMFWVMLVCCREIAATDIYQIGTIAEQIYLGYALGQSDQLLAIWPDGTTGVGYGVHLVTIAWTGASGLLFLGWLAQVDLDLQPNRIVAKKSRAWKALLGWLAFAIVIVVPIGNLIFRTCFVIELINGAPYRVFRIEQLPHSITRVFTDYRPEMIWSLLIGLAGATLLISITVILSHVSARQIAWRGFLFGSIVLTLALPGPLIGTSLLKFSQSLTNRMLIHVFDRTIMGPLIASSLFVWPMVAMLVWQWFRQTNRELLNQSEVDGAGTWSQLFSIVLSGRLLQLLGFYLLALALMLGELSACQTIVPAGMDTLPRLTLGLLHSGVEEMTAAVSLVTATVIGTIACLGFVLLSQHETTR